MCKFRQILRSNRDHFLTEVFPKIFCSMAPFGLEKVTKDSHTHAYENTECPNDKYPKL